MSIYNFLAVCFLGVTVSLASDISGYDTDQKQQRVNEFTLPQETTEWAESIMTLVRDTFPEENTVIGKFQELVDWSCGEHADLKSTDPVRRAATIRFSLSKLLEMASTDLRVGYITEQLERHKRYVPKS